jgi:hypothetical protein
MNRRLMVSTMLAGGAAVILAPAAFADADWCDDDPLVEIRTPAGQLLPVHVTNYALGQHLGALKEVHNNPGAPYISYTIVPGKHSANDFSAKNGKSVNGPGKPGDWDITLSIVIPGHPITGDAVEGKFKVKAVVSTEANAKGTILGRDEGWSDRVMSIRFSLTV